jgi:hypothetical protein
MFVGLTYSITLATFAPEISALCGFPAIESRFWSLL